MKFQGFEAVSVLTSHTADAPQGGLDLVVDSIMSSTKRSNLSFILDPLANEVMFEEKKPLARVAGDDGGFAVFSQKTGSFLHVSFSAVVLCTLIGSLLVCAVNMKNKEMLRSPYNVNIFHLAITDLFVALVIVLTPGFVNREILSPPNGKLGGQIFCRVISSHFLTFSTATTSIYITVALATERWYAVARPLQYRAKFHTKRLVCEVFMIWALALCVNCPLLFKVSFDAERKAHERCKSAVIFASPPCRKILAIAQFLLKFLIPFLITCKLYSRVLQETQRSHLVKLRRGGLDTRHSISRMSAVSTLVLGLCWFPNQVYYTCSEFDWVPLSTPAHYATIVVALVNSCLNPFIFAFHSKQYRYGFRALFCGTSKRKDDRMNLKLRMQMFRLVQLTCGAAGVRAPPSPSLLPKCYPPRVISSC